LLERKEWTVGLLEHFKRLMPMVPNGHYPSPAYTEEEVHDILLPFVFKTNEQPIQVRLGTHYYSDRKFTVYVTRGGLSGVYMGVGIWNSGHLIRMPVEQRERSLRGTGTLVVTNQHVLFASDMVSLRFPLGTIVSCMPYSDGFALFVEKQPDVPHVFVTGHPGTNELDIIQSGGAGESDKDEDLFDNSDPFDVDDL
jgi:hypothetical protein